VPRPTLQLLGLSYILIPCVCLCGVSLAQQVVGSSCHGHKLVKLWKSAFPSFFGIFRRRLFVEMTTTHIWYQHSTAESYLASPSLCLLLIILYWTFLLVTVPCFRRLVNWGSSGAWLHSYKLWRRLRHHVVHLDARFYSFYWHVHCLAISWVYVHKIDIHMLSRFRI